MRGTVIRDISGSGPLTRNNTYSSSGNALAGRREGELNRKQRAAMNNSNNGCCGTVRFCQLNDQCSGAVRRDKYQREIQQSSQLITSIWNCSRVQDHHCLDHTS